MVTRDSVDARSSLMRLRDLAADRPWPILGDLDTAVSDVQFDSRLVTPGALFVALRGGYVDGHDFVPDAIARGAAALVVERELAVAIPQVVVTDTRADLASIAARFFRNPSHELRVIGITGTDGKTTTSYILDHILRRAGRSTGMVGTVSVRVGDETIDHETRQTTPESVDIQRILRRMVDAGVTDAILEATSHGLDLHRLDHVRFEVGVVTNITQEHLEHHGSIDAYRRAKGILFERVGAVGGDAIINMDDAGARLMCGYSDGCRKITTYSLRDREAALFAEITESGLDGSRGVIHFEKATYPLKLPLLGTFNVSNSLAALGSAIASGVDGGEAAAALASVPAVPGRMSSIIAGQPFGVIVDYAHTPESLEKVLRLLRSLRPEGRLIVVFGSAGERDAVKRPIQGRVAAQIADIAVITNEDPRYEDAETIIRDIAAGAYEVGGIEGETVHLITERRDAISLAMSLAGAGDTILLAGKGHERSIIWNGVKHPWDEATVAREELARLGWT
jgi:UDP-N-acetylmuramoyl-L-alanyl-D-glutamate--2,6-diaminopimelate ligase